MAEIGIFYGGTTKGSTHKVAGLIAEKFGKDVAKVYNLKDVKPADVTKYNRIILGTSAWGIGGMHDDWERFIDFLMEEDLSSKKIALFGLGDQEKYPESFVDGMGTMFCRLETKDNVVGFWPKEGYNYYFSTAEIDGKFVGLAIDDDTQKDMTNDRVTRWVEQLKGEFGM